MGMGKDGAPGSAVAALLALMTRLRDPERGCPWDSVQTFETIAPYTIEEAYETADAIARGDLAALRDELGDLLFQVVFHAELARERGAFDFDDIARAVAEKMRRRHPHVFGDRAGRTDREALNRAWERQKADERAARAAARPGALDGVALALPALVRAQKLQRRAAQVGFDWPDPAPVLDKVAEELGELRDALDRGADSGDIAEELGDLLFACVNAARHLGTDAEDALRACNRKFVERFEYVEARLAADGRSPEDSSLAEMDALWAEAKRR